MSASLAPSELVTRLPWHQGAIATVGGALLDGVMASCRYTTAGEEHFRRFHDDGRPVIFTLWHGRLLPCTYHHRGEGVVTLVSLHRDGEYITRAVRRWGYVAVRGSTSRGGLEALRELIGHVRDGRSLAITPDGPRGPREQMKPGPVLIAQRTGAPIIPVAASASRGWYFGGWDRFLVPRPFARCRIEYGEPVHVPRRLDEAGVRGTMGEVESRLAALMRRVDA
jgi:lysophospholipid acyltransferase (LPLAT)-like uncharacterized protein